MKAGVYYIPCTDEIVILNDIEIYEDLQKTFAIVGYWENKKRAYSRCLLPKKQFKLFKRVGSF